MHLRLSFVALLAALYLTNATTMSGNYIVTFEKDATDAQIKKYEDEVTAAGGKIGQRYTDVMRGFSATMPTSLVSSFTPGSDGALMSDGKVIGYVETDGQVTTQ